MKLSKIAHWLLRMFVYSCMGTSAMLLMYDFQNDCWFCRKSKDHQSEAAQYIRYINKGQQAYYVENNSFAKNSFDDLGLGIRTDTNAYSYRILSPMTPVQNLEGRESWLLDNQQRVAIAFATPKYPGLKSYIGMVWIWENSSGETITKSLSCQTEQSVLFPAHLPDMFEKTGQCPTGFTPR